MSSSLFSSKRHKSLRNLKAVVISPPLRQGEFSTSSDSTSAMYSEKNSESTEFSVILKAKYKFEASASPEISLRRGEFVKFLKRPGNGWLEIKRIDQLEVGIVPASYVEIAVNDPNHPITTEWLNDYVVQDADDKIVTAKIVGLFCDINNQLWYCVHATTKDGHTFYCRFFYQDFKDLQAMFLEVYGRLDGFDLPPYPRNSSAKGADGVLSEGIFKTYSIIIPQLEDFLDSVNKFAQSHPNMILTDYIHNHCARTFMVNKDAPTPADEDITKVLSQGSYKVTSSNEYSRNNSYSTTLPLPPVAEDGSASGMRLKFSTPYINSNVKYSSYLTQNHKPQSHISAEKQSTELPRSTSSNTITSFSSLIEYYDNSSLEDKETASQSLTNSSYETTISKKDVTSTSSDPTTRTYETRSRSFSNSCTYSGVTSISSHEPHTPTIGSHSYCPVIEVIPSDTSFSFSDCEFSPLMPRKHNDSLSSSYKISGLETQADNAL